MNVLFLFNIGVFAGEHFYVKTSGLKVQTIRTRDQFSISIIPREPSLQVIFHSSCVIKSTTDNRNHSIRQFKGLVKFFSNSDHLMEFVPTLRWISNAKLLNFLELMNSENSPSIFSMSSSLFSKTSRKTTKSLRQLLLLQNFISKKGRNRLFRSSNEIKVFDIVLISVLSSRDFVQLLVEVLQLTGLSHNLLLHKERCLQRSIFSLHQKLQSVVNKSHVQNSPPPF